MIIQQHIPLAEKTWFKTGGAARYYCEPTSPVEFQEALAFAQTHLLEIFVLGEGANLLVSDNGFDGLVIRPQLKQTALLEKTASHGLVYAQAGATFNDVIQFCFDNNLIGLEEFSGIPGTVGGSVFINIHYFEFLLSHFLVSAEVIHKISGEILTVDNAWFNFGYNTSRIQTEPYYVVSATFKVKTANDLEVAYVRGRSDEMKRTRGYRYPKSGTCGSFFRNFLPTEVEHEKTGKKLIYVAYYLDQLGVKGQLAHGGAQVSHQHANMLVNKNNATALDIITVARRMQELVFERFGLLPEAECQFVGFKEYPLYCKKNLTHHTQSSSIQKQEQIIA